jgi:hypothetical protein
MEITDVAHVPDSPSSDDPIKLNTIGGGADGAQAHAQCDACGAVVAHDQRYCVVCGTQRRHVRDPAVRFLSRATADARAQRARQRTGAATARRAPSLAAALLVAVIPLALALGVLVGRASTSGDAKLIAELQARKPEVITTAGTSAGTSAAPAASASSRPQTLSSSSKKRSQAVTKNKPAKSISSTQSGATQQLTTKPPSQQQLSQGAADVKKVQQASGKSYVNSQQGLPDQVSVP